MKLYLSVDMEGMAGIAHPQFEKEDKVIFREMYHQQVKWVIEGIQKSTINDQITEITISDSHALGLHLSYNLLADMDERISLVSGYPRKDYMMSGLDESYDLVFFVGYHAGIGEQNGCIDHGYSARAAYNLYINGEYMNETTVNAAYAAELGVPVGLIIGDSGLETQLSEKGMMPWVSFVKTKDSLGRYAVKNRPRKQVREDTIAKVVEVLESDYKKLPLYQMKTPAELKIQFYNTAQADKVELLPGTTRHDGRTVSIVCQDMKTLINGIVGIVTLAGTE